MVKIIKKLKKTKKERKNIKSLKISNNLLPPKSILLFLIRSEWKKRDSGLKAIKYWKHVERALFLEKLFKYWNFIV